MHRNERSKPLRATHINSFRYSCNRYPLDYKLQSTWIRAEFTRVRVELTGELTAERKDRLLCI